VTVLVFARRDARHSHLTPIAGVAINGFLWLMRPVSAHLSPGAGCSITSAATVSTTGATSFRAAFFTGARLGLAPATVRFVAFPFAAFVTLRALPRLAELTKAVQIMADQARDVVLEAVHFLVEVGNPRHPR
jgi:hypothetical protein